MKFRFSAWLMMILIITPAPLTAQSESDAQARENLLSLRLVALGHRRLAKFEKSEKARVIKIKTPDGETIEETIPAGVPIEIQGERFEYLPSILHLKERGLEDGKKHLVAPLVLNSATPYHEISSRGQVELLLKQAPKEKEGEPTFSTYAKAAVGEDQSHMIVTLINRHTEKEGWRNPVVRAFDVSPNKLPGGSILFFNSTPFPMEVDIRVGDSYETITVESMKTKSHRPETDNKGRSLLRANIVARNGLKKQIYLNSVKVGKTGRTFLFAYFDPRKKTANPAGLVQFSDILPTNKED